VPRIHGGPTRTFRVVSPVALVGLVILGGLAIYPAHLVSLVSDQRPQVSLSSGEHPFHYTLGNVTLGPPGAGPSSVVFDPQTGNVYAVLESSCIKVISARNDSVLATVDIRTPPLGGAEGMAFDSANGNILIETRNGTTAVFSPSDNMVVRELPGGSGPVLYDPVTNRVLVANGQNLTALNGTTFAPVYSLPLGSISALSYDPASREIYVVQYSIDFNTVWTVTAVRDTNFSVAWQVTPPELTNHLELSEMAYDSANGDLYIPSGYYESGLSTDSNLTNFVLVLNATTGTTVGFVPVGASPGAIAYDSQIATVFVTNVQSANVSAIHGTSLRFGAIPVGGYPEGVASANGTGDVFVTNYDSDTVSVINDTAGKVVATVTLGGAPDAVAYDPNTESIYAAGGESVEIVSETNHSLYARTPARAFPQALAYDSRTGNLYVANGDNNTVSVVSGTTHQVLTTVSVGSEPDGLAYDNTSGEILVACYFSNAVYAISDATDSVTTVVSLGAMGGYPTGVVYDAATNDAYVSDFSLVSVISGSTWQATAALSSTYIVYTGVLALDNANGDLYVPTNQGVEVVSTATASIVARVAVAGGFSNAAAFDAATGDVFVTNSWGDNVSVIDGNTNRLIENLTVGEYPAGVAYDSRTGEIYVANEFSDTLSYIVATAPPPSPLGVVFWVVLGSIITIGACGMVSAAWNSRPSARSKLSRAR
jgi:YVTN family beta-propeller protein